jgi:sensor histidine kinase YesM
MNNYSVLSVVSFTVVLLLLIVGVVFILLLARKSKIESELKEVIYENQLNRAELSSLRAQMNPHFIFNCLNSIRLLTEKKDTEAASAYLEKFSQLIRNNLEQARSDYNTLRFEIQTLELYLQMESLRIKDKVDWQIEYEEEMDLDSIEIPSMFLQPYVENAIWHGLMHRNTRGKLWISMKEADDHLVVTIEDNGIGRKASAAINAGREKSHNSLASRINEERIAKMGMGNVSGKVDIFDLYDEDGSASGTRVLIEFPI